MEYTATSPLYDIYCPTNTLCRAVGDRGTILVWTDTSATWTAETSETTTFLYGITCPTAILCKAVGLNGTILGMAQQTLTDVSTGFSLNIFNDSGCLTNLTAIEYLANHPNATTSNLQTGRYWDLGAGSCAGGFTGEMTIPVLFTPDANDKVCRYTGGGWDCAANSFTGTTITRHGITGFSLWTGGDDLTPTALVLSSFSAQTAIFPALAGLSLLGIGLMILLWRKKNSIV
ncbi:MAG: hypothetical protein Fur0022_08610 [Anaerolineales bacterium]